jgi:hypothetical protein
MTEEELKQVVENLLQIQANNDFNFQALQVQIDDLRHQLDNLNDLKEMFRLPKPENKNCKLFEEIN